AKTIETVVMHYEATPRSRARTTICVSSQVGCPIGCSFCATGQSGFDRNLSEAEIVDQFLATSRDLGETQRSLTNVVFMGMGAPRGRTPNEPAGARATNTSCCRASTTVPSRPNAWRRSWVAI